jgi:hypothetical protein
MTLTVKTRTNSYDFDGPYTSAKSLQSGSGVYVITTETSITTETPEGATSEKNHRIIDAGESGHVQRRIGDHDRADEWERHKEDGIYMSAFYCDKPTRKLIEKDIRDYFDPPCGDR